MAALPVVLFLTEKPNIYEILSPIELLYNLFDDIKFERYGDFSDELRGLCLDIFL